MKKSLISINTNLYTGIVAFILGICIIAIPQFTIQTIVVIIGLIITIGASISLVSRLKSSEDTDKGGWNTVQNVGLILNVAFGFVLIFLPHIFVKIVFILMGIIIAIQGISQITSILKLKPLITPSKIFLAIAILMTISGFVIILYPFAVASVIMTFVGIIITFYGLGNIIVSLWLKGKNKN